MAAVGSAPTKLLLFGEHSAVYGFPAVGIPLSWRITVTLKDADRFCWKIDSSHLSRLNPILPRLTRIFPEIKTPFEIAVHSDAPIGVGFGSSGALCVAIARAVFAKIGHEPTTEEVWTRAHALESHFHNNPSGVDTGISTMEQAGFLKKDGGSLPSFQQLNKKLPCLIIGAFPRCSNTGNLISGLRHKLETEPQSIRHIEELGRIAEESIAVMDNPMKFGELANMAHNHLKTLGLSTPELDRFLKTAISHGAFGGKLSGAGGGGAFYLACENSQSAKEIIQNLSFPSLLAPSIIN